MKQFLFWALLLLSHSGFCQEVGDKKIIVHLSDTSDVYNKVRIALGKNDFIVREDGKRDTVTTHPADVKNMAGYSRLTAIISGNTITLSGVYSLVRMNDLGYTRNSKNYKPIVYYKASKTWKKLLAVANSLNGEISFAQ